MIIAKTPKLDHYRDICISCRIISWTWRPQSLRKGENLLFPEERSLLLLGLFETPISEICFFAEALINFSFLNKERRSLKQMIG